LCDFSPQAKQSAGRSKPGTTGKGNPWLAGTLGEAALGASRTKTFLGSCYHRLARRRGKQRALVAVGNSLLVIAWHLLSDPEALFTDLGPDWHDRLAPIRRKRQLIAELERLSGKKGPAPRGGRRLTRPYLTQLRCAPPGAAARPAQVRFSIQLASADTVRKRRALGHDYERHW
jgi:hypothetical protein